MPKVTLITPVKIGDERGLAWLAQMVKSVRAQTFTDWEHVLVDDGSPVTVSRVARALGQATQGDNRFRLYQVAGPGGCSNARNQAANMAQAELLLPVDADDYIAPDTVEQYLKAWKDEPGVFLYPSVAMFDESGVNQVVEPYPYDFDRLLYSCFLLVGNLHRKADWKRAGGWKPAMVNGFEDWEYWLNCGRLGICGQPVKEALYYYRRNPTGRSSALMNNPALGQAMVAALREIHKDLYEGIRPMACCGRNRVAPDPAPDPAPASRSAVSLPGAESGLVAIEYLLQDDALTPWYGPVSGQRYMVSRAQNVIYVDARDLTTGNPRKAGLLEMWDKRQQVFRLYSPPQPAAPPEMPVPQAVAIEPEAAATAAEAQATVATVQAVVAGVKADVAGVQAAQAAGTAKKRPGRKKSGT